MFAFDTGRVSPRRFGSGYAPDSAVTFFCFAKRKSPKKRRAGFVARRFAPVCCVARFGRGAQKLALRAQTSAPLIRPPLRYSPPHNGVGQPLRERRMTIETFEFTTVGVLGLFGCLRIRMFEFPAVEAGLSSVEGYWGQTPISLRHIVPHPTGEPKARRIWALTPKTRSSARNREAALTSARLSFGYVSLAKQRKVPRPPGRDPASMRT